MNSGQKFFSIFFTGFVWLLLLASMFSDVLPQLARSFPAAFENTFTYVTVVVVVSLMFGIVGNQLSMKFLAFFGALVDFFTSRWSRSRYGRTVVTLCSDWFGIFSSFTIMEEIKMREEEIGASQELPLSGMDRGWQAWGVYKQYILAHSPNLGGQLMVLETEINIVAGFSLPVFVLGVVLQSTLPGLGSILIIGGLYLMLRFQRLRHYELSLVAQQYRLLRAERHE